MKQKDILFLSISVFIVIVAWISFSIYHNLIFSTISQPTAERLEPITPEFNTQTIENIKKKKIVQVSDEIEVSSQSATTNSSLTTQLDTIIRDLQASPSAQEEVVPTP